MRRPALLLKRYLTRVDNEELIQRVPRLPDPQGGAYAGTAACQGCHPTAHTTWSKSAHAHAFQTSDHRRPRP